VPQLTAPLHAPFCGPPCIFNPKSIAHLLCLVLWREEYASHSLPVSPFAHQILGKPPSEIKLTFLYFTDFRKLLKTSPKLWEASHRSEKKYWKYKVYIKQVYSQQKEWYMWFSLQYCQECKSMVQNRTGKHMSGSCHGLTEKNHNTSLSGQPMLWLTYKLGTSKYKSQALPLHKPVQCRDCKSQAHTECCSPLH
jgi:hypothetical protein